MNRWADHRKPSTWKNNPNKPLYQDMQKYGVDKFRFQILAPVMPEYLKQVEQGFIELLHPSYNSMNAKGWDIEKRKESQRKYQRKHQHQLCEHNGETLTLNTLRMRFHRAGIRHPILEAKKYIIKGVK